MLSGPEAAAEILDLAGVDARSHRLRRRSPSVALAQQIVAPGGEIVVVGLAGGYVRVGGPDLPPGVRARFSFGSHRRDIYEVIKLAQAGTPQS